MSKITDVIFKDEYHKLTSPFGYRSVILTSAGATKSFHSGADYGTDRKNLPMYAIASGYVFAAQKASDGAYYIWIVYPSLKKAFLYYHMKALSPLRAGQKVEEGTLCGYAGMSGKATGIHLHLGIRDVSGMPDSCINAMTWSTLQSCPYIDPETYANDFVAVVITPNAYLPARGYIQFGDNTATVGNIAAFMRRVYPAYTPKEALGNIYGKNIQGAVKIYQKRKGLKPDGLVGPITLQSLIADGLKL